MKQRTIFNLIIITVIIIIVIFAITISEKEIKCRHEKYDGYSMKEFTCFKRVEWDKYKGEYIVEYKEPNKIGDEG